MKADSSGSGAAPTPESLRMVSIAAQALAGSNRDVVANRRAIRMANMTAAEVLKAELSGARPLKASASTLPPKPVSATTTHFTAQLPAKPVFSFDAIPLNSAPTVKNSTDDTEVDEFGRVRRPESDGDVLTNQKRSFEEGPGAPDLEDVVTVDGTDDDESPLDVNSLAYKVNADGTVTQEDTVK